MQNYLTTTSRLTIRPLQTEDIPVLAALWCDPQVTAHMGGPRDFAKVAASFEDDLREADPPKFDLWPVVETDSGKIIGHCGLLPKDVDGVTEIELIYVITPESWGRGYATEAARALCDYAFTKLDCTRLVSLIDPQNTGSERVATKAGLRHERDTLRPNGKVLRVYSIAGPRYGKT